LRKKAYLNSILEDENKLSYSKIMAKNSSLNSLNYTIRIIIALFLTPYIINKLGMELFGLWALLGIIPSYAILSDLGISRSVVKFVA